MRALIVAAAIVAYSSTAQAQHHEPVADVVNLQAEASREVENDQLIAVLVAEAQGGNPAEVAETVNKKMAEALKSAKEVPSVKLRSGNFQTFPQRGKEGRIESWHVSQELRLEAGDITAAARLIGMLQDMLNVRSMAMRLAPLTRRQAEDSLIPEAVAAFEARAELVRKALHAKGYSVRELGIGMNGSAPRPLQYESAVTRAPAVAVEAGSSQVTVTVSGSIQLRR